jgi:hypothetical protein
MLHETGGISVGGVAEVDAPSVCRVIASVVKHNRSHTVGGFEIGKQKRSIFGNGFCKRCHLAHFKHLVGHHRGGLGPIRNHRGNHPQTQEK